MIQQGALSQQSGSNSNSDPTMILINRSGHQPTQELFLQVADLPPLKEMDAEQLADLPEFFHDLPRK